MYEKTFSEMKIRRSTSNLNIQYRLENKEHLFKNFILDIFGKKYQKVLYFNLKDSCTEMQDTLLDKEKKLILERELGDLLPNQCLFVFDEIQAEDNTVTLIGQCKEEWENYHMVAIGYRRNTQCRMNGKLVNGDVVYCEHFPQFLMLLLETPEYLSKYPKATIDEVF